MRWHTLLQTTVGESIVIVYLYIHIYIYICMCVCVCVYVPAVYMLTRYTVRFVVCFFLMPASLLLNTFDFLWTQVSFFVSNRVYANNLQLHDERVAKVIPGTTYAYIYIHVCVWVWVYVCVCVCAYIYIYIYIYVCDCICVCICKHMLNAVSYSSFADSIDHLHVIYLYVSF